MRRRASVATPTPSAASAPTPTCRTAPSSTACANLYPVHVGDWVTIGHNATVHGCVLEDAVLVGIGATILNDARIGEGSIIAAGAVIPEHTVIPPNSLVAGVPGTVRRTLGEDDRKLILQYAKNYLDYTAIYSSRE